MKKVTGRTNYLLSDGRYHMKGWLADDKQEVFALISTKQGRDRWVMRAGVDEVRAPSSSLFSSHQMNKNIEGFLVLQLRFLRKMEEIKALMARDDGTVIRQRRSYYRLTRR